LGSYGHAVASPMYTYASTDNKGKKLTTEYNKGNIGHLDEV